MVNKNGISAIVATVMVILITVAGVAIIWMGIIPMINNGFNVEDFDVQLQVDTASGYTTYDAENESVLIQVRRGPGGSSDVTRIKIILIFDGNSESDTYDAPGPNEAKTYFLSVGPYGVPNSVEVIPLIVSGNKIRSGPASSKVDIPANGIASPDDYVLLHFGDGDCVLNDTISCGSDVGECSVGVKECILFDGLETWGGCGGDYVGAEEEICDDKDHDCDGADTNGLTCDCVTPPSTRATSCGAGVCASSGVETCTAGSWADDTCTAVTPGTETCNNLDDDCDSEIDESVTQSCGSNVGECSYGSQTCSAGSFGSCVGGVSSVTEVCGDGLDNDCDSETDEGCDSGDTVSFTNDGDPSNEDCFDNICLKRYESGPVQESSSNYIEWACGVCGEEESGYHEDITELYQSESCLPDDMSSIVGTDTCLYVSDEDTYWDVSWTGWDQGQGDSSGSGGGFSYERTPADGGSSGGDSFTKDDGGAQEDCFDGVCITRDETGPVYDTLSAIEWACGVCGMEESDYYTGVNDLYQMEGCLPGDMTTLPGSDTCLHVVGADTYWDVSWTGWSCCDAGGFSYERTSGAVGPIAFTKDDGGAQEDCFDGVCITRDYSGSVYSSGMEWACGVCVEPDSGYYGKITDLYQMEGCLPGDMTTLPGSDTCLHVVGVDTYWDVSWTGWTSGGSGGGFSYEKTLFE
jgi:hypothetical protein